MSVSPCRFPPFFLQAKRWPVMSKHNASSHWKIKTMRPPLSTSYPPVMRFVISTLAGIAAPALLVTLLALCFGHLPPLSLLFGTLPLSAMLALLTSGSWLSGSGESRLTQWLVSMIITVGITFEASVLLVWINIGHTSRFHTAFVVANVIWASTVWLASSLASHRLARPANRGQ